MLQAEAEVRVRYAETDAMGIVYHGSYFPWFECARIKLLDDVGLPYVDMEKSGVRLPVIEASIRYHEPAFFDDRLRILAEVEQRPRARMEISYQVKKGESLLCTGRTVHAFMDTDNRPCRPPTALRRIFDLSYPSVQ